VAPNKQSEKSTRGSSARAGEKSADGPLEFVFDFREKAVEPATEGKMTRTEARRRARMLDKPVVFSFVNNPG
jgi:hypothetical protein